MLFDELDIERQLAPDWIESKLYCNIGADLRAATIGSAPPKSAKEAAERSADVKSIEEAPDSQKAKAAERKARWQDQCFLIEGWRAITDKFQRCTKETQESGYQHIIPVRAESSDVVSVLADREDANLFFNLSPAQLSMLVPSIRLFIVRYKQEKRGGKSVVVPDDSPQELYLDDLTEQDLVRSIMGGKKGRAEAIGLESFTYEFDGKDPSTTDTLIKASLNLVFTSFDTLLRTQDNGAKFLDLMLRSPKMVEPSRRDDISKSNDDIYNWCKKEFSKDKKETNSELIFNPQYKRIKASIGWAIPPGNLFFELFPPEMQNKVNAEFKSKIVNLLESMKLHLFLEMTTYDLKFDNNGKVKLSINFRAAVEGELTEKTANIFYRLENSVKKSQSRLDKRKEAKFKERDEKIKNTPKEEQKEVQKELAKETQEEIAAAERRSTAAINADKLYWYSSFIDELESTQRLIKVTLKEGALTQWRGDREFASPGSDMSGSAATPRTGITAGQILKSVFENDEEYGTYVEVNHGIFADSVESPRTKDLNDHAADMRAVAEKGGQAGEIRGTSEKKDPNKDLAEAASMGGTNNVGDRSIYFTFLGDILDAAMTIVNKYNAPAAGRESTIALITSQLNFTDPASQVRENDKRLAAINISDIPVSYDEFLLWFNNKIIKPGETNYPIMKFIKDVMTHLVFQAFGYNCPGGAPGIVPILNYTIFDVPKKNGQPPLKPGFRYNGLSEIKKIKKGMSTTLTKAPSEVVNYIILHGSARSFVNKNAQNLEQDEKDGIYHFGLGLDRGILKDINFEGNTLKYSTEARVIEDGQSGLEELFAKFDATVNLYGCPIFRNGQRLFLDPRTMGVSSDIARAIGLGGYYSIYNVSGDLNRSNYTMQLKCKYEGAGLCGNESIDVSRNVCATDIALNQWKEHNENKQVVGFTSADQQTVEIPAKDTPLAAAE